MDIWKTLLAIALITASHAGSSLAASAGVDSSASRLIGSWEVDVARLPIPPEARPKSVTIAFTAVDKSQWKMRVDIVDGGGHEIDATGTYTLDGKQVAVTGSPEADAGAVKMPTLDVLILALSKAGVPASTRIYAVAPGGKNMVETAVYYGPDGKPIMRTNYFSRAP